MSTFPGRILRIPLEKAVKVLHCDPNLIVALEKPCGLLSQPNKSSKRKEYSLLSGSTYDDKEFYKYSCLDDHGARVTEKLWLLNRLDSATSGVILCACDEKVATIVKKLFKEREVIKTYYARVFGHLKSDVSLQWENQLSIVSKGTIVAVGPGSSQFDLRNSKLARTTVRSVEYDNVTNTSLIELKPLTGYSHQLRFQCAEHGYPIVGDKVYGDFDGNKAFQAVMKEQLYDAASDRKGNYKRLMLHSYSINFKYTGVDKKVYEYSAVSAIPLEFYLK